jgi:hypothetical protein
LNGDGQEVIITLGELGDEAYRLTFKCPERDIIMPLIVMNACGSSRLSSLGAPSFPRFFLERRNRGFVGTEVEIPDDVATAFSKALYGWLLVRGAPLGRAVYEARQYLLRKHSNPLGLAFTAYADAELQVDRKEEGE